MSKLTLTPPALSKDERRILQAFRTMDTRRRGESARFMQSLAKSFPMSRKLAAARHGLRLVIGGAK